MSSTLAAVPPPRARAWQTVLAGNDAERAEHSIDAIARALSAEHPALVVDARAALTDGLPGWALFFAQRHRVQGNRGHAVTAARLLDDAVSESADISGSQALFGGITGLAWAIQHLASIARPEHVAALDDIDTAMRAGLDDTPTPTEFDLISGLVGLGVLMLERAASPAVRETLERLVIWLDATAEHTPRGISWRAPPDADAQRRALFPDGYHNPGVAHGTAGVVGLLAGALRLGIAPETTRRLLVGAVDWVFAQELPGNRALFPYQVDANRCSPASRSAWCRGGPGISLMLWRAGDAANEPEWQTRATALAHAATHRPFDETGVNDPSLCHGAAGLGQLYARWFNATGDEAFRDEAAGWFRRTLDYQRANEGVGGYSAAHARDGTTDAAPGLLFGAAGVGLALMAATSSIEPEWDRVFLMSDPPVPVAHARHLHANAAAALGDVQH